MLSYHLRCMQQLAEQLPGMHTQQYCLEQRCIAPARRQHTSFEILYLQHPKAMKILMMYHGTKCLPQRMLDRESCLGV